MRIVAGTYRSRLIQMPKGVKIRPTQDRVREAIFNILGARLVGAKFLDLFSGSGAFGIEALSRGAREAVFIDNNPSCISTIKKNLISLHIEDNFKVIHKDALKAIKDLNRAKDRFDIVFLDPPYYKSLSEKSLIAIDKCDIIHHSSFVIAEHFKKDALPESLVNLKLVRQSKYGDTAVSFYNPLKDKKLGE